MNLYLIIDGVTKQVVAICDSKANAEQMVINFIKAEQYRLLRIEEMSLNTDNILPLGAVKVRGRLLGGNVVGLAVEALNLSTTVTDSLLFTVNDKQETWFEGVVNLNQDEIDDEYLGTFKDRVSILGGEPLAKENRNDVINLIAKIKSNYPDKNIWLYTGYTIEELLRDNVDLHNVDYLVDGEYVDSLRDLTLEFRGSSNQHIWKNVNGTWELFR